MKGVGPGVILLVLAGVWFLSRREAAEAAPAGVTYEEMIAQGWTPEELAEHYADLKPTGPAEEAPAPPLPPGPAAKYYFSFIGNQPSGTGGIRFIEPPESQLSFNDGDTLTLEAVPRDGYQFAGWQLDAVLWRFDNPLSFTMSPATLARGVNHEIIATYVPL